MNKNVEEPRFKQNPKLGISVVMQRALDWWNELPLQNIYDCRKSKSHTGSNPVLTTKLKINLI